MRGKGRAADSGSGSGRITPAYAGKSLNEMNLAGGDWDHPRLCGEKAMILYTDQPAIGSPPPMRGKVKQKLLQTAKVQDHPRLCGEKFN